LEDEVRRLKDENENLKKHIYYKKKQSNKTTKSSISIIDSTIYGGVGNHIGDNFYGTKVETNINQKEQQ